MRKLFTTQEAYARGLTSSGLRWGERAGRWTRIERSIYGVGPEPPSALERQRARVRASGRPASGALAGVLLELDSVVLDDRPTRRREVPKEHVLILDGVPCVDATLALRDLSSTLDDDTWEQALESALRKLLTTIADLEAVATPRIRRVLARRPPGAPPTESLLETLALQLARLVPGLGEPVRQHRIVRKNGTFVARVDLCWPEHGIFLELDGQGHKGQPVYDAHRQTAVIAATGWLVARFTWWEVTRSPRLCVQRLTELLAIAA